jgi:hypothetical protein
MPARGPLTRQRSALHTTAAAVEAAACRYERWLLRLAAAAGGGALLQVLCAPLALAAYLTNLLEVFGYSEIAPPRSLMFTGMLCAWYLGAGTDDSGRTRALARHTRAAHGVAADLLPAAMVERLIREREHSELSGGQQLQRRRRTADVTARGRRSSDILVPGVPPVPEHRRSFVGHMTEGIRRLSMAMSDGPAGLHGGSLRRATRGSASGRETATAEWHESVTLLFADIGARLEECCLIGAAAAACPLSPPAHRLARRTPPPLRVRAVLLLPHAWFSLFSPAPNL